jgi:hypothetical protein
VGGALRAPPRAKVCQLRLPSGGDQQVQGVGSRAVARKECGADAGCPDAARRLLYLC